MTASTTKNTIISTCPSIELRRFVAQLFDFGCDVDAAVGDDAFQHLHALFQPFGMGGVLRRLFRRLGVEGARHLLLVLQPGLQHLVADAEDHRDTDDNHRNHEDGETIGCGHGDQSCVRRASISRAVRSAGAVAIRSSTAIRASSRETWPVRRSFSLFSNSVWRLTVRSPSRVTRLWPLRSVSG